MTAARSHNSQGDGRRDQRVSVMRPVQICTSGPKRHATLLDASSRGMLLSAQFAPERGEVIEVTIDNQVVIGKVSWSRQPQFGVALRERLDPVALATGRGQAVKQIAAPRAQDYEPDPRQGISDHLFLIGAGVASLGFLIYALRAWF
jgi:PilZ domain